MTNEQKNLCNNIRLRLYRIICNIEDETIWKAVEDAIKNNPELCTSFERSDKECDEMQKNDCISREALLEELGEEPFNWNDSPEAFQEVRDWEWFKSLIETAPPVTPQPKTGHWSRKVKVDAYDIAGVKTWGIKCQCDRCDFTTIVVEDFGYYKYCPNCGAKMEAE